MGTDKKIFSVNDYIKTIIELTSKLDVEECERIFWFRGEASAKWTTPLIPNIYRVLGDTFRNLPTDLFNSKHIKQLEQNISTDFYRKALPYIIAKGISNTSWERYFLMQHYKIKTRLLDWTENAIIALFFALNDEKVKGDDAKVWILQPLKLNNFTIQKILNSDQPCILIPTGTDHNQPQELLKTKN